MCPDSEKISVGYFENEESVREAQDKIISNNQKLRDHIDMMNDSFKLIKKIIDDYTYSDECSKAVCVLMTRCLNSATSALLLFRYGYYQPGHSIIRDLFETTFLLELFYVKPDAVKEWCSLEDSSRKKEFSPVKVREHLSKLQKNSRPWKQRVYNFLSIQTHPTPESFVAVDSRKRIIAGPFADEKLCVIRMGELAIAIYYTAMVIHCCAGNEDVKKSSFKGQCLHHIKLWEKKYMGRGNSPFAP